MLSKYYFVWKKIFNIVFRERVFVIKMKGLEIKYIYVSNNDKLFINLNNC